MHSYKKCRPHTSKSALSFPFSHVHNMMLQRQTLRSVQRFQWVRAMSALNKSSPQSDMKPHLTNKPVNSKSCTRIPGDTAQCFVIDNTTSTDLQDNLMTSAPLWNEDVATESEIAVRN